MPTAVAVTVCGLPTPSSTTLSVARRDWAPCGRNAIWTVHDDPAARLTPEHSSLFLMKSSAPRNAARPICKVVVPVFVTITGLDGLVSPAAVVPRSTVGGLSETVLGGGGGGD